MANPPAPAFHTQPPHTLASSPENLRQRKAENEGRVAELEDELRLLHEDLETANATIASIEDANEVRAGLVKVEGRWVLG